MVLRLLRDLLNMEFKCLIKKASHYRQKYQILTAALRSPPYTTIPPEFGDAKHWEKLTQPPPTTRTLSKLWSIRTLKN